MYVANVPLDRAEFAILHSHQSLNSTMKSLIFLLITIVHLGVAQTKPLVSSSRADTWVATDALGRQVATETQGGAIRKDKFVGIFYFIWQGAHGYDQHSKGIPGEGVIPKSPGDTISPYDITKLLEANPDKPAYGPIHAFHHWGEPYFGYYLPDDEWVIRKHAQMLSDAGVDVLMLDVTNAAIYLPQVTTIVRVYKTLRQEGRTTPSLAFIVNSNPKKTVERIYDTMYKTKLLGNLWFRWKGKPLLLCPPEAVTPVIDSAFTTRQSWAWSKGQAWFGDGKDKWTWVDHTPQSFGWHDDKNKPEQISVAIAEHPMSNIGRSFHDGKQPDVKRSGEGLYLAEQWKRAHEVDPEFVFVTGWNEWVAMRFNDGASKFMMGKPIRKGETYFVDLYNAEYSRDAEPMKGAFTDNYYYQLVDNIRKFKGTRALPVVTATHKIGIDGRFSDWQAVKNTFTDDAGDTFHRRHPGWGRITEYVDTSGRNDIVESKVTSDNEFVFFYVRTANPLTAWKSPGWMQLYIGTGNRQEPAWQGFQYMINRTTKNGTTTTLERSKGGWNWETVGELRYRKGRSELEVRIPKKALGITSNAFTLDFKWADNVPADGDAMHWLDKGDTAPNARFRYRYTKQ